MGETVAQPDQSFDWIWRGVVNLRKRAVGISRVAGPPWGQADIGQ